MFNLFKKTTIDKQQRFALIIAEIEKRAKDTSKTIIGDLRFLEVPPANFGEKEATHLLSLALTESIGLAIISLNIGIRNPKENRPLVYDTFVQWEESIRNKSIKFSSFLTEDVQTQICNRFLKYHSDIQYFSNLKEVYNHINDAFFIEAKWLADYNGFKTTEKYLRLTTNTFLQNFSYFDRFFSKFNHV